MRRSTSVTQIAVTQSISNSVKQELQVDLGKKETQLRLQRISRVARERALQLANKMVGNDRIHTVPAWTLFDLARKLRAIEGIELDDVEVLMLAVFGFCEIIGKHTGREDFADDDARWAEFVDAWYAVHTPDGQGPLDRAFALAAVHPVTVHPSFGIQAYPRLVGTLFHLQRLRGSEKIFLPVTKIGALFGRDKMFGWRLINRACVQGLLVRCDPHSRTRGHAATFRFQFECRMYQPPEGYTRWGFDQPTECQLSNDVFSATRARLASSQVARSDAPAE